MKQKTIQETQSSTYERRAEIAKVILHIIAAAGVIAIAIMAPNAIHLLALGRKRKRKYYKYDIHRSVNLLIRRGEIKKRGTFLQLTSQGRQRLFQNYQPTL